MVLLNLGGPTSEEAVRPFLFNLFSDPDIIKLGGGRFQRWLAGVIAKRRAPKVAAKYERINGCPNGCAGNRHCPNHQAGRVSNACSPLNPLTEQQRQALAATLQQRHPELDPQVYAAFRYWKPFTDTTLADLHNDGITELVLLPLYPQFSWTTTGSSLREWESHRGPQAEAPWQEAIVRDYHRHPGFIRAVNERIDEALERFPAERRAGVHIVFSAHGTPLAEVRSGDPYTQEVRESVEAVMAARGNDYDHWLGFQSRVGPAKWTEPNTVGLIERLLNYGQQDLLVVPIAFVTDHIETLMELKIELPEELEGKTIRQLEITEGLNTHPAFIGTLADEVERVLGIAAAEPSPSTQAEKEVHA